MSMVTECLDPEFRLNFDQERREKDLEFPEGDVDGDAALALGLEFIENPRILERRLCRDSGFRLKVYG